MKDEPWRSRTTPVLVIGAPRAGATWVAEVLSLTSSRATWVNEPDNEWLDLFALRAKLPLGRFPILSAGDHAPEDYQRLWQRAFAGFPTTKRRAEAARIVMQWLTRRGRHWSALCDHSDLSTPLSARFAAAIARPRSKQAATDLVVVKSAHAVLALEWLAPLFAPRVVVVLRHPLDVIASWLELGWGGCALDTHPAVRERFGKRWNLPELPPSCSRLTRIAWEVGLFTSVLRAGLETHDRWIATSHETLCTDPERNFRSLCGLLGLEWTEAASSFIARSNRPGTGLTRTRLAADQPGRWRKRLTGDQVQEIWSVLSCFDVPWVQEWAADL